jgi:hypothetical protein
VEAVVSDSVALVVKLVPVAKQRVAALPALKSPSRPILGSGLQARKIPHTCPPLPGGITVQK